MVHDEGEVFCCTTITDVPNLMAVSGVERVDVKVEDNIHDRVTDLQSSAPPVVRIRLLLRGHGVLPNGLASVSIKPVRNTTMDVIKATLPGTAHSTRRCFGLMRYYKPTHKQCASNQHSGQAAYQTRETTASWLYKRVVRGSIDEWRLLIKENFVSQSIQNTPLGMCERGTVISPK